MFLAAVLKQFGQRLGRRRIDLENALDELGDDLIFQIAAVLWPTERGRKWIAMRATRTAPSWEGLDTGFALFPVEWM